jgi:hypothetical protein
MSGMVEVRARYYDRHMSPWIQVLSCVVLATGLILWTILALIVGYAYVGMSTILSVSKRNMQKARCLLFSVSPKINKGGSLHHRSG